MAPNVPGLPELDPEMFVMAKHIPAIEKILWRIDPPYFSRLDPEIVARLARVSMDYRIKAAELEVQAKQLELDTLKAVNQVMRG